MPERIKLHGEKAERFRELHDRVEERLGYRPSKAEALGHIMAEFPERDERGGLLRE
jgi:hypothetical protein